MDDYGLSDIEKSDSYHFSVKGFRKKSYSFLILLIITYLLSATGYAFIIMFISLIFIIAPSFYKKIHFEKLSIWALVITKNRYKLQTILSLIPYVDLGGEYFIEINTKEKKIDSVKDVFRFIFSHWFEFLIVNTGFAALILRTWFFLNGDSNVVIELEDYGRLFISAAAFSLFILPVFMAIYFSIVWVWRDAEIKVIRQYSNKNKSKNQNYYDPDMIWFASTAIKNLAGLLFGFPAVLWLGDKAMELSGESMGASAGFVISFFVLYIIFIISSGPIILMGIMYYRSGIHEYFVNNLRNYIKEQNQKNENYSVKIGSSYVKLITEPKKFNLEEKEEKIKDDIDQNNMLE